MRYYCLYTSSFRLPVDKLLDKARKPQQIGNPKKRSATPDDDFWVQGRGVSPLRGNGANRALVGPQQKPFALPVVTFSDANEPAIRQRVERVGHA